MFTNTYIRKIYGDPLESTFRIGANLNVQQNVAKMRKIKTNKSGGKKVARK